MTDQPADATDTCEAQATFKLSHHAWATVTCGLPLHGALVPHTAVQQVQVKDRPAAVAYVAFRWEDPS